MKTLNSVSIHEAKTNLSKLVKRAAAGETILIGAYGKSEAAIVPLSMVQEQKPVYEAFGVLKDKIVLPEGWEEDIPKNISDSFYEFNSIEDFTKNE